MLHQPAGHCFLPDPEKALVQISHRAESDFPIWKPGYLRTVCVQVGWQVNTPPFPVKASFPDGGGHPCGQPGGFHGGRSALSWQLCAADCGPQAAGDVLGQQ